MTTTQREPLLDSGTDADYIDYIEQEDAAIINERLPAESLDLFLTRVIYILAIIVIILAIIFLFFYFFFIFSCIIIFLGKGSTVYY